MSLEKAKDFLKLIEQNEQLVALRKEFTSEELAQAEQELALDDVSGGSIFSEVGKGIQKILSVDIDPPSSVPNLV